MNPYFYLPRHLFFFLSCIQLCTFIVYTHMIVIFSAIFIMYFQQSSIVDHLIKILITVRKQIAHGMLLISHELIGEWSYVSIFFLLDYATFFFSLVHQAVHSKHMRYIHTDSMSLLACYVILFRWYDCEHTFVHSSYIFAGRIETDITIQLYKLFEGKQNPEKSISWIICR